PPGNRHDRFGGARREQGGQGTGGGRPRALEGPRDQACFEACDPKDCCEEGPSCTEGCRVQRRRRQRGLSEGQAVKVEVKLHGLDEIMKTLRELPAELASTRGGPVRTALRKAAVGIPTQERAPLQAGTGHP